MATIDDVQLDPKAYVEIYAETGIAAGTQLLVQNKSRGHVYVQSDLPSQPDGSSRNGFIIEELDLWLVPTGTTKAWFKGDGALAVEVM